MSLKVNVVGGSMIALLSGIFVVKLLLLLLLLLLFYELEASCANGREVKDSLILV